MAYDAHEDGRRDFHFLYGRWSVQHRRLKARGAGCAEWDEFAGTSFTQGLMDGLCNVEEHDFPSLAAQGVALRAFDLATRRWSIYWVSSASGELQAPVRGGFRDGVGRFEGEDLDGDRSVKVRFLWSDITPSSARWSQAFSYDGGATWEENWTMAFTRAA
ncbi:MAG: hypothetical protein GC203_18670 [Phenylobacterium sp.]|uniref:DUF1579 domain-containing protein n=1 Tax=Phenylobacterium sp. TaxID=1871053 RepID=UPI0025FC6065|nr:DUF1579 domain-containing protein [Phenylobacterium sp.]MBI1199887.1 hypothetical protein [Phenylobacterium sp.]